jgi:hypothetical protein
VVPAGRSVLAATRPLRFGAEGEARSDSCGAAACGRGLMAKPSQTEADSQPKPSQTEVDSPGASTSTFDFVWDSTSDLNASTSVSIGGKVL